MFAAQPTLYPFCDHQGRRGYIDAQGNVVIPAQHQAVGRGWFSDGRAVACQRQFGFIDTSGNVVVPLIHRGAHPFSAGRAWVRVGNQWGIIDVDGNTICEPKYWAEQASGFHERHCWLDRVQDRNVRSEGSGYAYGYVDRDGQVAIPFVYDWAGAFYEERASVRRGRYGFVDPTGKLAIDHRFTEASYFSEGLSSVKFPDGQRGYVDRFGNVALQHGFHHGYLFHQGRAMVESRRRFGYIDTTGATVIPCEYSDSTGFFASGVALARRRREWILIDRHGNPLGNETFDKCYELGSCDDELLCVAKGGKWGFINAQGEYVVTPRFSDRALFHEGLAYVAEVKSNGLLTGYINRAGEYVWTMMR